MLGLMSDFIQTSVLSQHHICFTSSKQYISLQKDWLWLDSITMMIKLASELISDRVSFASKHAADWYVPGLLIYQLP